VLTDYLNSHTARGSGVLTAVPNLLQVFMGSNDLETTKEYMWI
jgi:hypothetical protein